MRTQTKWVSLILTLVTFSCVEKVDFEEDQFVKILGQEGTSIAEQVVELENGDLMIIGEMGVAAHDIETGSVVQEIGRLEDQAPFIAITDHNGNLKMLRKYPLHALDLKWITLSNYSNKTVFKQILPLKNGGYAVLARTSGFDYEVNIPGVFQGSFESTNGNNYFSPLLFKLDANFNVVEVATFNAGPDWNGEYFRIAARMKPLPNDEIGILLGRKISDDTPIGYTFLRLNHELDTIEWAENFDNELGKLAYDFAVDNSGKISVFGAEGDGSINIYSLAISDSTTEVDSRYVSEDGVFSPFNVNEHYLGTSTISDELISLYTNPRENKIYVSLLTDQFIANVFEVGDSRNFPDTVRALRGMWIMSNGDILIYEIIIPATEVAYGYLYRYSIAGDQIFSRRIDGSPGDVIETKDGNILLLSNEVYNGLSQRITVTKLNEYGQLF